MKQWMINFVEHPATTLQGVAGGAALVAMLGWVSTNAHCDWSLVSWGNFVAFAIPTIIGGGAKS